MALLDTFAKLKAMVLAQTESVATDFTVQAGISISELIFMGHQRIGREVRCRQMEGTLSASSSDSQATGRWQTAIHSLTAVVFPKPAGAEMSVNLRRSPSSSRSIRRGRRTAPGCGGGM